MKWILVISFLACQQVGMAHATCFEENKACEKEADDSFKVEYPKCGDYSKCISALKRIYADDIKKCAATLRTCLDSLDPKPAKIGRAKGKN